MTNEEPGAIIWEARAEREQHGIGDHEPGDD